MSPQGNNHAVPERVDVAVVGCGVAGGLLAGRLARDGISVIALEKRPRVGVPVRCGEAAGSRSEMSHFIPVDESWIVADINAARMYAPDGRYVEKRLPGVGLMLRRDVFDQALARQAAEWGADVRTWNEVTALTWRGDAVTGVTVKNHHTGTTYDVEARLVVGADGIEGWCGRWAKLAGHLRPRNIHSAIEYLLEGGDFPDDVIELYLGTDCAPGGYAWVFPKGPGRANVGLGVHPTKARRGTAREYLDRFVAARYPRASVLRVVAGGVSGSKPLETMVADGVLLVGEAGRQNNPFSGGGIMNALEGADEAHRVVLAAFERDDLSPKSLRAYDRAWHDRNGHLIQKFFKLRELFFKLDDDNMNNVVSVLDKAVRARPGAIADYADVFRAAFMATPGVLWQAGKMLW
ncbi:MAG: geranylgeranyl reductase family protein [Candidatus Krumholzibacteriia bacterium]